MQVDRPTVIMDVMGADRGIEAVVRGAAQAAAALAGQPTRIVLVTSDQPATEQAVTREFGSSPTCELEIIDAPQRLPAAFSSPVDVYRSHPECSIRKAMDIARDTPGSAVVSPGTTGLVMTSAMFTLGRVKGIDRAPIGTPMPTKGRQLFFVDGGSVVDCKARHLYQFAMLAHVYIQNMRQVARPSIALLSNGSEEYKGNAVVREAFELLHRDKDLNFVGYVEGHTMFRGDLDIMVCDGFIGNILLKFAEGASSLMSKTLRDEIKRNPVTAFFSKLLLTQAFQRFKQRLDYAEFGGAPLLGLNGNVVICHGRSPVRAFKNALLLGRELAVSGIARQVSSYIADHPHSVEGQNGAGGETATDRRSGAPDRRQDGDGDPS